jgi:hypothetical protein
MIWAVHGYCTLAIKVYVHRFHFCLRIPLHFNNSILRWLVAMKAMHPSLATGSGRFKLWSTIPPMYPTRKHPVLLPLSTSSFHDESKKVKKGWSCCILSLISMWIISASIALL